MREIIQRSLASSLESYQKVDLRTITLSVPPQEVLTRDSVTVSVDAVVYYRVSNATVSVANVENAHHSTRLLAQTTLRNILGTKSLHEILSDRESISSSMQVRLDISFKVNFICYRFNQNKLSGALHIHK